ncbi:p27, putative [Brugia malayi]|uniref:BMA-HSP-25, isoform c n=1 Tax=Brugia malayi TaxID=6279 RepID=A0A4E9ERK7_BRUMA|nr:p27, putative [Brugia malayi]VIO85906.1 p27, putative [Brugia malayi]
MQRERKIDVTPSNYSVLDTEFGSMRERFETEMRHVEEEMKRLRREFEGYTPSQPGSQADNRSTTYHREESRRYESSSTQGSGPPPPSSTFRSEGGFGRPDMMSIRPTYDPYLENLKSPLIKDESDGKTLRLRFDVAQYKPEEVTVKTVDNRLLVHAKHEEKTPQRAVFREYNQEFMLPRGTNPELISSTLSTDGVLTVEAPLPHLAIQH